MTIIQPYTCLCVPVLSTISQGLTVITTCFSIIGHLTNYYLEFTLIFLKTPPRTTSVYILAFLSLPLKPFKYLLTLHEDRFEQISISRNNLVCSVQIFHDMFVLQYIKDYLLAFILNPNKKNLPEPIDE